jgi:hypothetical protein
MCVGARMGRMPPTVRLKGEGGMRTKPRRRRRSGSLGALKSSVWAVIEYNVGVLENPRLNHDLRQRACNSLTQAALAYSKILELCDLADQVKALEALAPRNGQHRS